MSYYHEARKHEKNIRKQANKHKDFIDKKREESQRLRALADPHQSVIAEGRTIKIHRATETVRMDDALMPWQGRRGNMIDRFDARAMMDFITEYNGPRQPEECKQVECLLNYERFRSIVDCTRLGVPPSKHLERVALEVRKKLVLTQPPKEQGGQMAKGGKRPAVLHGVEGHYGPGSGEGGKYSAVEPPSAASSMVASSLPGISKEDQEILAMLEDGDDDSSSSSSSEEEEEEEVIGGPEAGEELTDQQVDRLAEAYGITGRDTGYQFTRLLRYERREREAARQHKIEERAKQGKKSKKRSRDKYQGDKGYGAGKDDQYRGRADRSYGQRSSPTYDDYMDPREDRRRGSRRDRHERTEVLEVPKIEFITTFSCEDPAPTEEQEASEDEEEQGMSHFDLMSSFFPAVATKLAGGRPLTTVGAFGCRPEPSVRPPSPSPPRASTAAVAKKAPVAKPVPKPVEALTPAERLKLRMRAQLNKQIKADKQTTQIKAEQERKETQAVVQSLQRKPADACVKVSSTSSRGSSRRSSRSRSPRGRSRSRSPPRRPRRSSHSRSRSRSRGSKSRRRTPSRSRSRSRGKARRRHRSRSGSPSRDRGRRRSRSR